MRVPGRANGRGGSSAGAELALPRTCAGTELQVELRYLANFERLIIALSERFIATSAASLDRDICHALKGIGTFAEVDRSYVFQFSPDGERLSNTHEWCAEGIEPAMHRVQDASVDRFAWAVARLRRAEVLHISDVEQMPADAAPERRMMSSQGIRSLINVPLVCAGKVLGFVGFDSVRARKVWCEEHIKLLQVVGQIMAGAIERERATAVLTRRVELEKLVAHISSRFIKVQTEELDGEIDAAIAKIGQFTGADRSYIFQLSADHRHMDNTHEWCAPGIEPHIERLQQYPVEEFGFSMEQMRRGEVFHVPDVSRLPPEAANERAEFEREGIRTLVNVPVVARGSMIGFLGFDAVRARQAWSDDDIRLLSLVGEILANALERKSTEERLQVSVQEKEVLLREIHHRVKNNMQIVHSLLYLQANAIRDRVDPVALAAFRQSQSRIKAMASIHERLYRSRDLRGIDFADYLRALIPDLLQLYGTGKRISAGVDAQNVRLSIDTAIPCGLIVNELVANSIEHAFPDGRCGHIDVTLQTLAGDGLELCIGDDGIGFPPDRDWRNPTTLGLQLVWDLAAQLDGDVVFQTCSGTRFCILFTRR